MPLMFKYTLSVEIGKIRDMEPIVTWVPNLIVHENQLESFNSQGLWLSKPGVAWESVFIKFF